MIKLHSDWLVQVNKVNKSGGVNNNWWDVLAQQSTETLQKMSV